MGTFDDIDFTTIGPGNTYPSNDELRDSGEYWFPDGATHFPRLVISVFATTETKRPGELRSRAHNDL
jgi:hypothetical protein